MVGRRPAPVPTAVKCPVPSFILRLMSRAGGAALLVGALLLALPAAARQTYDGIYTGPLTRHPEQNLQEVERAEVTVTVIGDAIEGLEEYTALTNPDYGENVQVVMRGRQWVTFSGTITADGSFSVPGRSYSDFEIVSCTGDSCGNVEAPTGNTDGYPVTVVGKIVEGVMTAEIVWDDSDTGTYAFRATNPLYTPPTTTTTSTTSTTVATTTTTAATADPEYGVIVRDGVIHLTSPPGETLLISQSDLPEWARGLIATQGDMYGRAGPPGSISGGDPTVLLDGRPVARAGDPTTMGGTIVEGSTRIYVNGVPAATVGSMAIDPVGSGLVPGVGGPILRHEECRESRITYWDHEVCTDLFIQPLDEEAARGDTRIRLLQDGTWEIGDGVVVGGDEATMETAVVVDKGSLILDRPLQHDHAAGEPVIRIAAAHVDQVIAPVPGDHEPPDDGPPILGIVALLAALGLGGMAVMSRRRGSG